VAAAHEPLHQCVSAAPTVAAALAAARTHGADRLDAQVLLAHHLQRPRSWLLAHDDALLDEDGWRAYLADVRRLVDHVPLAHLTGVCEFHGLTLAVTPAVLVPRPDTETLVDWALELLGGPLAALAAPRVVDLGTGSGAIALAIKHRMPRTTVHAVDASAAALDVARANARRLALDVAFLQGDWWDALRGASGVPVTGAMPAVPVVEAPSSPPEPRAQVHLAVSNPPYIAADDPHLTTLGHEPALALTPGGDGLGAIETLIAGAAAHLAADAWLLFEHGHQQAEAVRQRLAAAGFVDIATRRDLAGHERCTGGRWRGVA
jgi:release factor glutamine methyltransferase